MLQMRGQPVINPYEFIRGMQLGRIFPASSNVTIAFRIAISNRLKADESPPLMFAPLMHSSITARFTCCALPTVVSESTWLP